MQRRHLIQSAAAVPACGLAVAASAAEPVKIPRVTTSDGIRLFHRDWGAGRTILFVASWSLSSEMWNSQTVHLVQRGFRCVSFDRRGHGRSDDPGRGYDYDTLADDIAAVVEQLGLRNLTLVAHSLGAGEVVRYLTRHGTARIRNLVLLAPCTPCLARSADNPGGIDPRAFAQLRMVIARDYPKWIDDGEEAFVVPATSKGTRAWLKSLMLQSSLPALIECSRTMTSADQRAELRAIGVPTEVIQGDIDRSLPLELTGRPTAALIPGSKLTVYEGAPHGLFVTHAQRLNDDLQRIASA
jgi:non-heme chloroperoxidase